MTTYLITGGAGFIGSNFARMVLERHTDARIVVYDALTYAGNPANLKDLSERYQGRYAFVLGDIADAAKVAVTFREVMPDIVVNFAAASHVDRSILGAEDFVHTEVLGTHVLLDAAKEHGVQRYLQVSTDEVYGEVLVGASAEDAPLAPRNPYAAAKAGGDLLALSYHQTYGLPVTVTRGCNTYGPYHYPEKLIPLFITNAMEDMPLPLYGDGKQVREWIYVLDHCAGIDYALVHGEPGEVYNIGTGDDRENIEITRELLQLLGKPESLIRPVEDRPGHDRRYAMDSAKLRALGWRPEWSFEDGLAATGRWYQERRDWWEPLKNGEYWEYYQRQYGQRLASG